MSSEISLTQEDSSQNTQAEKIELIFSLYKKTFDIDYAIKTYASSDEEIKEIQSNKLLMTRVENYNAEISQRLIQNMLFLANEAESESVRMNAIKEMAKLVGSKLKTSDDDKPPLAIKITYDDKGENK